MNKKFTINLVSFFIAIVVATNIISAYFVYRQQETSLVNQNFLLSALYNGTYAPWKHFPDSCDYHKFMMHIWNCWHIIMLLHLIMIWIIYFLLATYEVHARIINFFSVQTLQQFLRKYSTFSILPNIFQHSRVLGHSPIFFDILKIV